MRDKKQKIILAAKTTFAVSLVALTACFVFAGEPVIQPDEEAALAKGAEFAPGELLVQVREGAQIRKILDGSGYKAKWVERLYSIAPVTAKLKVTKVKKDSEGQYWYKGKKYKSLSDEELFALVEADLPPHERALYRTYHLWLADDVDIEAASIRLKADPNVVYAEPNYVFKAYLEPADPLYVKYQRQQFHAAIKSPAAWDISKGAQVVVAAIDSGLDMQHADLKDNLWVNKGEIPDNGFDDDYNGYINDINGWNAARGHNDLRDQAGHGTFCAGLVAAPVNGIGVVGVSPEVKIMPVKVSMKHLWPKIFLSHVAPAVKYAVENDADIISMPLGCGHDSNTLRQIIEAAYDKGIFLVAAAGNEDSSSIIYPAGYNEVVSVASVDKKNERADFRGGQKSNFGRTIDIAAPGENITSAMPGNSYSMASGTSLSCSMVAGAAALVLSENPGWSPLEVKNALILGADPDIKSMEYIGMGVLDAEAALKIKNSILAEAYITDPPYYQKQDELIGLLKVYGAATGNSFKVFITPASNTAYAPASSWEEIGSGIRMASGILAQRSLKDLESGDYFVKLVVDAGDGYFLKSVSKFKCTNRYPAIKSFEPLAAASGEDVVIRGFNFGTDPDSGSVYFDGIKAVVASGDWSETEIRCKVPFDGSNKKLPPGPYEVTVSCDAYGVSNPKTFNVIATLPKIYSLTPGTAAVGAHMTIKGAGFGADQGPGNVIFDRIITAARSWSDARIDVFVPKGLSAGALAKVRVRDGNGIESNEKGFEVAPSPHIGSASPVYGSTGTSLSITGTNFGAEPGRVKFGNVFVNVAAEDWKQDSIFCAAPSPLSNGEYEVRVYDSAGAPSDNIVEFIVKLPVPHISSINPRPAIAGQEITISGFNFGESAGRVRIAGTVKAVLDLSSWSRGSIKAKIPPLSYDASVWVIVINTDEQESAPYALMISGNPPQD